MNYDQGKRLISLYNDLAFLEKRPNVCLSLSVVEMLAPGVMTDRSASGGAEFRNKADGLPELVEGADMLLLAAAMLVVEVKPSGAWWLPSIWILPIASLVLAFGKNKIVNTLRKRLVRAQSGPLLERQPAGFLRNTKCAVVLLVSTGITATGVWAAWTPDNVNPGFGLFLSLLSGVFFLISFWKTGHSQHIWLAISSLVMGIVLLRWDLSGGAAYLILVWSLLSIGGGCLTLRNFLSATSLAKES